MPLAPLKPIGYTPRMRKKATEDLPKMTALMTVRQVAREKKVTTTAVYNAIESGKLHPQLVGDIQVLFRWEVEKWEPQPRGPKQGTVRRKQNG